MFRLVLLTGLRCGELIKLSWSDFDPERKTLLFRDTKAGKDQLLPISEDAIQLFLDHPRHPKIKHSLQSAQNARSERLQMQVDLTVKQYI